MIQFKDVLVVSPYADGKTWYLREDFSYQNSQPAIITVPRGFNTDFASVPRVLWWLLPKWGKYGNAAVLHDYLYAEQKVDGKAIVREEADNIFREAMKSLHVPYWQEFILYWGVRLFGWLVWYIVQNKTALGYSKIASLGTEPKKTTDLPKGWKVESKHLLKIAVPRFTKITTEEGKKSWIIQGYFAEKPPTSVSYHGSV